MRWAGASGVIHSAIWWGQLLNRQHKYYGTEDVSQARENPVRWAITRVERKERKSVWRFVTSTSFCFRKGVGSARLRNVGKRPECWKGFCFVFPQISLTFPTNHQIQKNATKDIVFRFIFISLLITAVLHLHSYNGKPTSGLIKLCSGPNYAKYVCPEQQVLSAFRNLQSNR